MIHVVIDTSVYRQDPSRRKAGFKAVERLAKAEQLRLHIPFIVKREFLTQQIEEYEKHLTSIDSGINSLQRKVFAQEIQANLENFKNIFNHLRDQILKDLEDEFTKWADEYGVIMHPVADNHGSRVMESYFEGKPPFKSKKSRTDIPDAFIWEVVLDLMKSVDHVHVIAADGGLQDACQNIDGVSPFSSFDDLVSSDICIPLLREVNTRENIDKLLHVLPIKVDVLGSFVETILDTDLYDKVVESEYIPSDNQEASIRSAYNPSQIAIDLEGISYYGDGVFIIPFDARLDADLVYPIFKGDYYGLSEKRSRMIFVTELNDHYFDAEENYPIVISGTVSLTVDVEELAKQNLIDENVSYLVENSTAILDSVNSIEVDEIAFDRRLLGESETEIHIDAETIEQIREALKSLNGLKEASKIIQDFNASSAVSASLDDIKRQFSNINVSDINKSIGVLDNFAKSIRPVDTSDIIRLVNFNPIDDLRKTLQSINLSAVSDLQDAISKLQLGSLTIRKDSDKTDETSNNEAQRKDADESEQNSNAEEDDAQSDNEDNE